MLLSQRQTQVDLGFHPSVPRRGRALLGEGPIASFSPDEVEWIRRMLPSRPPPLAAVAAVAGRGTQPIEPPSPPERPTPPEPPTPPLLRLAPTAGPSPNASAQQPARPWSVQDTMRLMESDERDARLAEEFARQPLQ
eukprot:TRINITY_DN25720_c0_g1_i1.p1 TRINITY_DN25720_c0_g1~~TRINITY_DN25720_c0_g1_i1.p1  ORF type:complete len:137 (+),score=15.56 TRINITY_DN25720_c0_g1_i1:72-482(+)